MGMEISNIANISTLPNYLNFLLNKSSYFKLKPKCYNCFVLKDLQKEVKKLTDKKRADLLQRFFKTGVGEYGYGDVFAGLTVPQSRTLAIKYKNLSFTEVSLLLKSKIHEERLIALLILVHNFEKNGIAFLASLGGKNKLKNGTGSFIFLCT